MISLAVHRAIDDETQRMYLPADRARASYWLSTFNRFLMSLMSRILILLAAHRNIDEKLVYVFIWSQKCLLQMLYF